jgi:hypothetical protein
MHVAGAEKEAVIDRVGNAQLFLSQMYHRSGESTLNTVHVTFFYIEVETTPAAGEETSAAEAEDPVEVRVYIHCAPPA